MADGYKYAAFISYSSRDSKFAGRLHKALERYRIPRVLGQFDLTGGGKPNRLYPVFRDREELSAGHLGELIEENLRASAALIVVCSPNAAASPWVQKEIEYFVRLGRRDRIFAIIADDAPLTNAVGEDITIVSFPPAFTGDALAGDALEPLAADARKGKDGFQKAFLKVVAGIIGVSAGALQDRDGQLRTARRIAWGAGAAAAGSFALAAFAILSVLIASANDIRAVSLAEQARRTNVSEIGAGQSYPDRALRYALAALNPRIPWFTRLRTDAADAQLARAATFGALEMVMRSPPPGWVRDVDYAPNGKTIVTTGNDGVARIWNAETGALVREMKGHTARVNQVRYSPDGNTLLTGGWDGAARLWDAETGVLRATMQADNDGRVERVLFTPDGALALTGGHDGFVRAWDARTGDRKWARQTGGWVFALAASWDSTLIAAGNDNGIITLWDASTGASAGILTGHAGGVSSLDFSRDGARLISGGDITARIWDVASKQTLRTLVGHQGFVSVVRFSPDGRLAATGGFDRMARLWDAATGQMLGLMRGHTHQVLDLAFSPDGARIATAQHKAAIGDSAIRIWVARPAWNSDELGLIASLSSSAVQPNTRIVFSPDGKRIAALGDENQGAGIWNIAPGPDYQEFREHRGPVQLLKFSSDGALLITAGEDGLTIVRDAKTGKPISVLDGGSASVIGLAIGNSTAAQRWKVATAQTDKALSLWDAQSGTLERVLGDGAKLIGISFSPDARWIATASADGRIATYDPQSGRLMAAWKSHYGAIRALAASQDGRMLASGAGDNFIRIWNPVTGAKIAELPTEGAVWALAFSPDGGRLASTDDPSDAGSSLDPSGITRLWDTRSWSQIAANAAHLDAVRYLTFSADGALFATGGTDGEARIWDGATGAQLGLLKGHLGEVRSLSFSPDRKLLATGSYDGTVRLWDTRTNDLLGVLTGHSAPVRAAFAPDGDHLATASKDGSVRIWDLRYLTRWRGAELAKRVCAKLTRSGLSQFSMEELKREPSLDPVLDADPCKPPKPMARLKGALGLR